jgi:hypothetical protein
MEIKELKNYGVEMNLMFQKIPVNHPEEVKEAKGTATAIVRKRIGIPKMLAMLVILRKENKRISSISFPVKGQMSKETAEMLEKSFSGKAAMFCALAKVTDNRKAMEIMKEVTDATAYPSAMTELPQPKDFAACGDEFTAFKEYILEMFRVSKKAGIHDYVTHENTEDCLEFDITYCAIYEYMRKIAPKEACMANCYGDDILFPKLCPQIGTCFQREGNMAEGYSCCNTRYERMGKKHE